MKQTLYTSIFTFIFSFLAYTSIAQPPPWQNNATSNIGGVLQGNIQINGVDAETGDYIAAFNPDGDLVGVAMIGYDPGNMMSFFALTIYGNSGGSTNLMDDGEYFTIQVWDESTGSYFSVGSPASDVGPWAGNNTFDLIPSPITIDGVEQTNGFFTFEVDANSLLPIELSHFGVEKRDCNRFALEWTTATEINNDYFSIERSIGDIYSFETIAKIDGSGTTTSDRVYSYEDVVENPKSNTIYYRLKQTDYDGAYSRSNITSVNYDCNTRKEITAFPNPFTRNLTILPLIEGEQQIVIQNAQGQIVYKSNTADIQSLEIETSLWANGMYIIKQFTSQNLIDIHKVIKQD